MLIMQKHLDWLTYHNSILHLQPDNKFALYCTSSGLGDLSVLCVLSHY